MDRRWWKPLLILVALIAGGLSLPLWLAGSYEWPVVGLAGMAAAAVLPLIFWALSDHRRGRLGWRSHPHGTCPDCGYSNDGLGRAPCPECGGTLPPSDVHLAALRDAHQALGPSECVVCGRRFPEGGGPGSACPSCGSRHRRRTTPPPRPEAPAEAPAPPSR